ncbi:MAG: hypothetical protein EOO40_11500 [Deltaproteobacteria bacterium]|nr:MAG: hypothetical protein EOO40_11500 [Deltaproteobacteria bacterium]
MPSSFLRLVGLAAVLYFVFFVPIGHNKTLANHGQEVWANANMGRAIEVQLREIKQDVAVRLRQWRDNKKPAKNPDAVEAAAEAEPDAAPPPPPLHRKHRKGSAHGRPVQSPSKSDDTP